MNEPCLLYIWGVVQNPYPPLQKKLFFFYQFLALMDLFYAQKSRINLKTYAYSIYLLYILCLQMIIVLCISNRSTGVCSVLFQGTRQLLGTCTRIPSERGNLHHFKIKRGILSQLLRVCCNFSVTDIFLQLILLF